MQKHECDKLLPFVKMVDTVIQVGLGHWREGQYLIKRFPKAKFVGIEPVFDYCLEAKKAGFPGAILHRAAWHTSGETLSFTYKRDKTSMFHVIHGHRRTKSVKSVAIDDLFPDPKNLGTVFLWMDCEGSEMNALQGATRVLQWTRYVLCEVTRPEYEPEPPPNTPTSFLLSIGFNRAARHRPTVMFVRPAFRPPYNENAHEPP